MAPARASVRRVHCLEPPALSGIATADQLRIHGAPMNWDRIEGNWTKFKGTVKQQWGKLTDDQLDVIKGKREHLAGQIQESYGITREEADRQLSTWQKRQKRQ